MEEILKNKVEGYNSTNEPNAGILIYALQHLGYKNEVAICDIIDNSIDAGATKIQLVFESDKILIVDNGYGMTKKELDEALKLGSKVTRQDPLALGKYGMGLSTASMSIANKTTILTKSEFSEEILKTSTDINIIRKQNEFVKYLGNANPLEREIFNKYLANEQSGTIVVLTDCVGIKDKNMNNFANRMKREIARIYRKFMSKIIFFVNEIQIKPDDPLCLEQKGTEVYSSEDYEVKWKDQFGIEQKSIVHATLVLLPEKEETDEKTNKANMDNQGFSILRNEREIASAFLPRKWVPRHNNYNRFRGEISFGSDMDEAMGINFTKNGIDMLNSVSDILSQELVPQIREIGRRCKRQETEKNSKEIDHQTAENKISRKSNLLILPKMTELEEHENEKNEKETQEETKRDSMKTDVRFETKSSGINGNIYDSYKQGNTIVIVWNEDHPFYDKFVVSNKSNRELVSAVDYLIYTIAMSHLKVFADNENKNEIINQLISIMSNNMRLLLQG